MTVSVGETADSVPVLKELVGPVKVDTVKQCRERMVPQYPSESWVMKLKLTELKPTELKPIELKPIELKLTELKPRELKPRADQEAEVRPEVDRQRQPRVRAQYDQSGKPGMHGVSL